MATEIINGFRDKFFNGDARIFFSFFKLIFFLVSFVFLKNIFEEFFFVKKYF